MDFKFSTQQTVQREVSCSGIGLHSGARVTMKVKPAPANFGVRFRRMDLPHHPVVAAQSSCVVDTLLATTIGSNGAVISTIEHFMAALYAKSIDNVLVELDGPEVPILDGSAAPFFDLLTDAGRKQLKAPRHCLLITRPMFLREGQSYIKAMPSNQFYVRYQIDFPHPLVGKQEFLWTFGEASFGREIARARTFGFLKDVERLQSQGLALGGSLANAVVFDDYRLLNQDGFRYSDECVRHKLLDFIGDLFLLGMPLIGAFEVHKAGHSLHCKFLKQLTAQTSHHLVSAVSTMPTVLYRQPPVPPFAEHISPLSKCL